MWLYKRMMAQPFPTLSLGEEPGLGLCSQGPASYANIPPPPLGEFYGLRCFLRNGLCCLQTPLRLGNRLPFLNDFLFSHLLNIDFPPPAPLIEQKPIRLCLLFSRVWGAGGGGRARRLPCACASLQVALPTAGTPAAPALLRPARREGIPSLGHWVGAHRRPTEPTRSLSIRDCCEDWWRGYQDGNRFRSPPNSDAVPSAVPHLLQSLL